MLDRAKPKVSLTFGLYRGGVFVHRETVTDDVVKIGRDPKSHVHVDDELASRMHAVIEVSSHEEMLLIDLGNEGGTLVNGARVDKCKVTKGAEIQIGRTLVVLEAVEVGPAPEYGYALLGSGPGLSLEDVELRYVTSVEVMILWGTTVLHVQHLTPPRSFYVGETTGRGLHCDYFIPAEKLGTSRAPIVLVEGGSIELILLPGARGTLTLPGEPTRTLEEVAGSGRAQPGAAFPSAERVDLPLGGKARIEIGGLVFMVATVPAGKPLAHDIFANTDFDTLAYLGLSLAAHVGLIGAMAFFVPPLGLTDDEGLSRDRIYLIQQYLQAAANRETANMVTEQRADTSPDEKEGGAGAASSGEEGAMGHPNTRQTGHRYVVRGPADNPDPHIARAEARKGAADFGMIGVLSRSSGDPEAPTAPWGRLDSLGQDRMSAMGNLWGEKPGDSFGAGGLRLTGVGEGGGQSGQGVGVGPFGNSIGHGLGNGLGDGFGSGHGHLRPEHRPQGPRMRIGSSTVNGRLPSEIIQRIVRQNYGRFRLCYENGLRSNPSLQGRVSARFVIGRDGAVSNVTNGDSDLPNASVVECVLSAYYTLSFPQPESGIVSVVYPIVFSPGE